MVRRNSISGMKPFEKLFADTAREITEDDHVPWTNNQSHELQLNQAIGKVQELSNTSIIAITQPMPIKRKRGRRKTIWGQPLHSHQKSQSTNSLLSPVVTTSMKAQKQQLEQTTKKELRNPY